MNEDGHTSSIRDKILTITVKPGWKAGTKITFPKEGDQGPNTVPADIVFILKDKPHPRFERVGNDLIYTATIQLGEVSLDHINYFPPIAMGGIVNKVWMKFIETTSTNRNGIEITSTNRNATEQISEKYKANPVEHK